MLTTSQFARIRETISCLYYLRVLTSTRLRRWIPNLKSIVNLLERIGIKLLPDISLHALQMKGALVVIRIDRSGSATIDHEILKTILYVRSACISHGYALFSLRVPSDVKIINDLPDRAFVVHFTNSARARPDTELLIEVLSDPLNYDRVASKIPDPFIIPSADKQRFDGLDIKILDALMHDPWMSIRDLASKLGVKVSRLEKHVIHAENLITGYGLGSIRRFNREGSIRIALYKCSGRGMGAHKLALSALRNPFVIGCLWSKNAVLIQFYNIGKIGSVLHYAISDAASAYGCEEWQAFDIVRERGKMVVLSQPFIMEFNKLSRSWVKAEISVSMLLRALKY